MSDNEEQNEAIDEKYWAAIRKLTEGRNTGGASLHPCPACGHCPTCGRGGQWSRPYYPYSPYPTITWTTGTGNAYPSFQMPNPPRTQ